VESITATVLAEVENWQKHVSEGFESADPAHWCSTVVRAYDINIPEGNI
jgi:hypothetical protein